MTPTPGEQTLSVVRTGFDWRPVVRAGFELANGGKRSWRLVVRAGLKLATDDTGLGAVAHCTATSESLTRRDTHGGDSAQLGPVRVVPMAGAAAGAAAVRRRHSVADVVYGAPLLPSCCWLQIVECYFEAKSNDRSGQEYHVQ